MRYRNKLLIALTAQIVTGAIFGFAISVETGVIIGFITFWGGTIYIEVAEINEGKKWIK